MLLDVLALAILGIFVALGAARGAVSAGVGVVTLIVGYAAGFACANWFGASLASALAIPSILGTPVAGSLGFFAAFLVCSAVGSVLKTWDRERVGEEPRGNGDRMLGAGFGMLRGGLIVLLVSWLAIWTDAARSLSGGDSFAAAPDTSSSTVAAATSSVVESAVEVALSDAGAGAKIAARMVARPAATMESMQTLLDDSRIKAVSEDKLFWTYVQNGAVDTALNRASFYRIVNDDELRQQLADLGFVDPSAVEDRKVFREAVASSLEEIGPRLKGLRDDAEIQALAKDPEIIAMLESGDTVGLVTHLGIQKIVTRLSADL